MVPLRSKPLLPTDLLKMLWVDRSILARLVLDAGNDVRYLLVGWRLTFVQVCEQCLGSEGRREETVAVASPGRDIER